MRYRTTRAFQERFGLRRAGDLPPLERFELSGPEADRVRLQLVQAGHLADDAAATAEPGDDAEDDGPGATDGG
jgi:hypothetical protein